MIKKNSNLFFYCLGLVNDLDLAARGGARGQPPQLCQVTSGPLPCYGHSTLSEYAP